MDAEEGFRRSHLDAALGFPVARHYQLLANLRTETGLLSMVPMRAPERGTAY